MRLIVQIPCFNEAPRLSKIIQEIPREIPGIESVEVLVIDDGSSDGTARVAREAGADYVIRFAYNRGLSAAFQTGLREALRAGADIIINTDGDGQYSSSSIPDLVAPIINGAADMVVGNRRPQDNPEFSWAKRKLQRLGTRVVALAGARDALDAASGFRAYTREAALDLIVVNRYTYTIESTIQAGLGPLHVAWVPIQTNTKTRDSRLMGTTWGYVWRNALIILRVFATHRPLPFFGAIGASLALAAFAAFTPFLRSWLVEGDSSGHVQSILLGAVLSISAILMFAIGLLGELVGVAREVSHRTLIEVREMRFKGSGR